MVDIFGPANGTGTISAVERARSRLDARLANVRASAEMWGIRGDTPEGAMLTALLGSIAEMGEVTVQASETMTALATDFSRDLDRRREGTQQSVDLIARAARDGGIITGQLRETLDQAKLVEQKTPAMVAALIAPDLAQALSRPLKAGIRIRNHRETLRQWMLAGGAALGVFVAGLITGYVQQGKSLTEMQVDWCEAHPIMGNDGNGYCALNRLRPAWVPILAPGRIEAPLSGK